MKIRINGNSIRLRLSKGEVYELVHTGKVSSTCNFAQNVLVYRLVHGDFDCLSAFFMGNELTVQIPKAWVLNWDINETVGFDNSSTENLYILIEKDFQCLKPRLNEDESDLFINPQALH